VVTGDAIVNSEDIIKITSREDLADSGWSDI
jgi:hypothetical protein